MRSKQGREKVEQEVLALLQFACERLARSMYIKASTSAIRRLAKEIEHAALGAAIKGATRKGQVK